MLFCYCSTARRTKQNGCTHEINKSKDRNQSTKRRFQPCLKIWFGHYGFGSAFNKSLCSELSYNVAFSTCICLGVLMNRHDKQLFFLRRNTHHPSSSVSRSINPSNAIHPSIHLTVNSSINQSIHPSINQSIYLNPSIPIN